jgi:hypothetical protein
MLPELYSRTQNLSMELTRLSIGVVNLISEDMFELFASSSFSFRTFFPFFFSDLDLLFIEQFNLLGVLALFNEILALHLTRPVSILLGRR